MKLKDKIDRLRNVRLARVDTDVLALLDFTDRAIAALGIIDCGDMTCTAAECRLVRPVLAELEKEVE